MRAKVIVLTGLGLLAPACATSVTTVNGRTVVKFGAQATQEKLQRLNDKVNQVRKELVTRFGAKPEAELQQMDRVGAATQALRAELEPLRSGSKPFLSVESNLADVENWNATTRAGLSLQQTLKALSARALAEPPPTPEELDQAEAQLQRFTTGVRREWTDFAQSETKKLAEIRKTVAAGPELRAKARAVAEAKAEEAARAEARKNAAKAIAEAEAQEKRVRERLGADVPSEADLQALADALAKVEAISPESASDGKKTLLDGRVARALAGDEAAPALSALLGGDAVVKGQSSGKTLSVPLKVKKNHCVLWFGRFQSFTGTEKLKEDKVTASGDRMAAQHVTYNPSGRDPFEFRGVCATRDVTVTVSAKLEFTGTKNAVRYVGLDFEKSRFPRALVGHVGVRMPDHCDPEAWAAMWLNPIPGTLGYSDGEPVVVGGRTTWFAGLPGDWAHGSRFTYRPPEKVKFSHQLKWKKCDDEYGESPTSLAIKACGDRIEKRYESQWRSIDHARDIADGMSNKYVKYYSPAAEEKASRLRDAYDRDYERECKGLEVKAEKAFTARFEKLVDQLTDARPVDVLYEASAR